MSSVRGAPSSRSPATTGARVAFVVTVVALVYHQSLLSVLETLDLDSPLAYVGVAPLLAAGVAVVKSKALPSEPSVHDRQLDWIVALPLLGAALGGMLWLPQVMGTQFWSERLDLFTLPMFTAATVVIVFGLRTAWRIRLAYPLLFLAWPLPWMVLDEHLLGGMTTLTVAALHGALHLLPVATTVPGGGGSILNVLHHGAAFEVSIASQCTGANSTVGFLLVGGAFTGLVTGTRLAKFAWTAAGVVLCWLVNVIRLVLVLVVGQRWGETVAIDGLHPYLGMFTFALAALAMALLAHRFGLRRELLPDDVAARQKGPVAVPRVAISAALIALIAIPLVVADQGYTRYQLLMTNEGAPRLTAFSSAPRPPQGWSATYVDNYSWSQLYFGTGSTWKRYLVQGPPTIDLPAITVDSVVTGDLSALETYGVEACYQFHGYRLDNVSTVTLDGGVRASGFVYQEGGSNWDAVSWIWPVNTDQGPRSERLVLTVTGAAATYDRLVGFARQLVDSQARQ